MSKKEHRWHRDDFINECISDVFKELSVRNKDRIKKWKHNSKKQLSGMDYNYSSNKNKDKFDKEFKKAFDSWEVQHALDDFIEIKLKIMKVDRKEAENHYKDLGKFRAITKQEMKAQQKDDDTPEKKSLRALKKFINKKLNVIFNNQWTFANFSDDVLCIMDTNQHHQLEHYYLKMFSKSMMAPDSFMRGYDSIFQLEDRFYTDINFRRNSVRSVPGKEPEWIKFGENAQPQMNMMNGGAVLTNSDGQGATIRKYDIIFCILCEHEWVMTQEAVRGIGTGSYTRGIQLLGVIMDYYEREAKKYAHER